jgi:hypothetical protein
VADFVLTLGDRLPDLSITLLEDDGVTPFDPTDLSPTFFAAHETGSPTYTGALTIVSAGDGLVTYSPAADDFATPGRYLCKAEVTSGGKVRSLPRGKKLELLVLAEITK